MSMIFPNEMVEIGLVKVFPAIERIEAGSEADKSDHSCSCEDQSLLGEEATRNDCSVRAFTSLDHLSISVDVEVKDKAENDGVDLEVNGETVNDSCPQVLFLQQ